MSEDMMSEFGFFEIRVRSCDIVLSVKVKRLVTDSPQFIVSGLPTPSCAFPGLNLLHSMVQR